tara:strand:+ start:336 stop:920 length:585 start_codon:yes stop_codon:yes gene_type:complete
MSFNNYSIKAHQDLMKAMNEEGVKFIDTTSMVNMTPSVMVTCPERNQEFEIFAPNGHDIHHYVVMGVEGSGDERQVCFHDVYAAIWFTQHPDAYQMRKAPMDLWEENNYQFKLLNVDSSYGQIRDYLVMLKNSPFAYHLDDDLDDVIWGDIRPSWSTMLTMKNNARVLWRLHELKLIDWSGIWEMYNPSNKVGA